MSRKDLTPQTQRICAQAGSDPSNSSLVLRTSRESAESDAELYHILKRLSTDNIVGFLF